MRAKTAVLKDFLKQSCMSGGAAVGECILDFADMGVKLTTVTAANNVLIDALLHSSKVEEYTPIGKIGIDSLPNVLKLLERVESEFITFEKAENTMCFKGGGKKIEVVLKEVEFVEAPPTKIPDLVHDVVIELKSEVIKDFLSDVTALGADQIELVAKDGKLMLVSKGHHIIRSQTEVVVPDNLKVSFTSLVVDAIGSIVGNMKVSLKNDYPVLFESDIAGNGYIKIVVAPRAS